MAEIETYFEARMRLTIPDDDVEFSSDDVRAWLQEAIGFTGIVIEEIYDAEGASDLA